MKIRKPSTNAALSLFGLAVIVCICFSMYPITWLLAAYIIGMDVLNVVFWLAMPELLLTNPIENKEKVSNRTSLAE